jgi:hypothetical protein
VPSHRFVVAELRGGAFGEHASVEQHVGAIAEAQRLLVGFVYAAWVALLGGAAAALLHRSADADDGPR